MRKSLALFLLVVCLAACSMPETRMYSLRLPVGKSVQSAKGDASVAIFVSSPRYLTQPYIAFRTSPYELKISHYSKWDSSPDDIVREAFKENLMSSGLLREVRASNVVPAGFYTLKIHLKHFERSDEGANFSSNLSLDVTLVSPEGLEVFHGAIDKKAPLEDRSFLALAKALSGSLFEAAEEVRTGITKSVQQH